MDNNEKSESNVIVESRVKK